MVGLASYDQTGFGATVLLDLAVLAPLAVAIAIVVKFYLFLSAATAPAVTTADKDREKTREGERTINLEPHERGCEPRNAPSSEISAEELKELIHEAVVEAVRDCTEGPPTVELLYSPGGTKLHYSLDCRVVQRMSADYKDCKTVSLPPEFYDWLAASRVGVVCKFCAACQPEGSD